MTSPEQTADLIHAEISSDRRAQALSAVNRRGRKGLIVWEWAKTLAIAFALFFLVRAFLVEAFKIPSGSMERTLLAGDFLLVNKLVYGAQIPFTSLSLPAIRSPQRGDVIVFQYPEERTKNFVKRLVGIPGDTLAMRDGILIRNGEPLAEAYVSHTEPGFDPGDEQFYWQRNYLVRTAEARTDEYRPSRNNWGPIVVPEKNYFVLGDNRDNSLDSRYWGFVPDSLVRGRPMFVYYSYSPDRSSKTPWLSAVRWERLGERVH